jgi:hypothetical protein
MEPRGAVDRKSLGTAALDNQIYLHKKRVINRRSIVWWEQPFWLFLLTYDILQRTLYLQKGLISIWARSISIWARFISIWARSILFTFQADDMNQQGLIRQRKVLRGNTCMNTVALNTKYWVVVPWLDSPSGPGPPHCWGFEITLRYITLFRTPPDEWSARHRDLYLTTHNTHNRHSLPPSGLEPTIPASERTKAHPLDRAATGIGKH